jgi:RNA polymerase sigma factor FliA
MTMAWSSLTGYRPAVGDAGDQDREGGRLRLVGPGAASGGRGPVEGHDPPAAPEGEPAGPLSLEELVLSHQSLVPSAYARLAAEGLRMDREELLAFGQQGLVEAARRYDPEQGPFRRFAYYRVRGAMIDGMRAMGPWTRRGYERARMMKALDVAVESTADGQGTPGQISAEEASEKLRQHMASMVTAMTLGVFAERAQDGEEVISRDTGSSAEELLSEQQLRTAVHEALAELPEPDGTIVRRHYIGGERLDLIAQELGFSKSWASRIHSRALKRLGTRLRSHVR